ncbi:MAG: amino acid ABC transporter permease [Lachnospiraceae bacterium]
MKAEDPTKVKKSGWEEIVDIVKQLGEGMGASLAIFFLTLLFAMPLGLLLTFVRMSKVKVFRALAKIYISIMRGTPLMLQLLVVFFGPYYLFGMSLSSTYRFYAVIIGFSLNYAAYFAEIYRAGIEGIPVGQYEAASVLGYTRSQTFRKIIFPQMVKRVMPPVTNEVITLVKDTSLAFALAYTEMFTIAKQISAAKANIMPLVIAAVFYYVFNFIVAWIMERIEKKMQYYR